MKALFQAFNLSWDPVSFTKGGFIDPKDPRYASVHSKLTSELHPAVRERAVNRQLPYFFEMLFEYRKRVEDVLRAHSGVLSASGLYRLALRKSETLNRVIADNLGVIEDVLVELISPEGREFTVAHLAKEYGYPDVELWSIDADWA